MGKINYKWPCSIAMLVYQRVIGVFFSNWNGNFANMSGLKILWLQHRACEVTDQTRGKQQTWKCKKAPVGISPAKKSGLNNPGTVNRLIHCGLIHWCWTAKMMSGPCELPKKQKKVSPWNGLQCGMISWTDEVKIFQDFLDTSGLPSPLDDKAEWGHPTNQHMGDSHGRSENEPPGNGVKLVETTNQTLFVTFVSTLSPSTTSLSTFQVNEVMLNTPKIGKLSCSIPHVDLLNACFFQAKTDFHPFGARKPLVRPRAERAL